MAAVESAAWRGGGSAAEQGSAQAQQYAQYLSGQASQLTVIGPGRITLAGLKGAVPVSISNRLGYAVKVMLEAVPSSGLTVKTQPSLMVIPPGQQEIKKVEVAAATVGPAKLRLRLLTPEGVPFPAPDHRDPPGHALRHPGPGDHRCRAGGLRPHRGHPGGPAAPGRAQGGPVRLRSRSRSRP